MIKDNATIGIFILFGPWSKARDPANYKLCRLDANVSNPISIRPAQLEPQGNCPGFANRAIQNDCCFVALIRKRQTPPIAVVVQLILEMLEKRLKMIVDLIRD